MQATRIGASGRFFANALTFILSGFAAWGWCAAVSTWPPRFSDIGVMVMALLTLTTQQLGNTAAAEARQALRSGAWFSCLGGVTLSVAFAAVTSFGLDHALAKAQQFGRAEAAASIASEIAAVNQEAKDARSALLGLPSSIPASRLLVLQAPLRETIEATEARLQVLRERHAATLASTAEDRHFRAALQLLGFAEIGMYWLLAGSMSQSQAPSQSQRRGVSGTASRSRPDGGVGRGINLSRAVFGATTLALSSIVPGAAKPLSLPVAIPAAAAAPPPPRAPRQGAVAFDGAASVRKSVPKKRAGTARGTRGVPDWFEAACRLRDAGLSFRAIAGRIGVPKSTVARRLKAHAA